MSDKSDLFNRKLKVINIGIKDFYDALKSQDVDVVHINWKPPAGGDKRLLKILDRLDG